MTEACELCSDLFDKVQLEIERKNREIMELSAKFSKHKLQSKAKIAQLRQYLSEISNDSEDINGERAQSTFSRLLLKLDDSEGQLAQYKADLDEARDEIVDKNTQINDHMIRIKSLEEQLDRCQASVSESTEINKHLQDSDQDDIQKVYAQIVYKDTRILELNNTILEKDRQILDIQELCREKTEVAASKTKAVQILRQQLQEYGMRESRDVATETVSSKIETSAITEEDSLASPGHAVVILTPGTPPPADPSEGSSFTTDTNTDYIDNINPIPFRDKTSPDDDGQIASGGKKKSKKRVTFDLRPQQSEQRLKELEDQLQDSEVTCGELREENEELRQVVADFESIVDECRKERQNWELQLKLSIAQGEQLQQEVEEAKKEGRNQSLKAKAQAQSRIKDMEVEIEQLKSELGAINGDVDYAKTHNRQLQTELYSLRSTFDTTRQFCDVLETENRSLAERLELETGRNEQLTLDLETAQRTADAILEQKQQILSDVDELKEALEASNQLIDTLEADIEVSQTELTVVREQLDDIRAERGEIQAELVHESTEKKLKGKAYETKLKLLERENSEMDRDLITTRLKLKAFDAKLRVALREKAELSQELNTKLEDYQKLTNNFQSLTLEYEKRTNDQQSQEVELQKVKTRLETLSSKLLHSKDVCRTLNEEKTEFENDLKDLWGKESELKRLLGEKEALCKQLEEERHKFRSQCKELILSETTLSNKVEELTVAKRELKDQSLKLKDHIAVLESGATAETKQLAEQLKKLKEHYEGVEQTNRKLEARVENLKTLNADLEDDKNTIQIQLDSVKVQLEQAELAAKEQLGRFELSLESWRTAFSEIQQENAVLKSDITEKLEYFKCLESDTKELSHMNLNLKEQLSVKERENEAMRSSCASLQDQLDTTLTQLNDGNTRIEELSNEGLQLQQQLVLAQRQLQSQSEEIENDKQKCKYELQLVFNQLHTKSDETKCAIDKIEDELSLVCDQMQRRCENTMQKLQNQLFLVLGELQRKSTEAKNTKQQLEDELTLVGGKLESKLEEEINVKKELQDELSWFHDQMQTMEEGMENIKHQSKNELDQVYDQLKKNSEEAENVKQKLQKELDLANDRLERKTGETEHVQQRLQKELDLVNDQLQRKSEETEHVKEKLQKDLDLVKNQLERISEEARNEQQKLQNELYLVRDQLQIKSVEVETLVQKLHVAEQERDRVNCNHQKFEIEKQSLAAELHEKKVQLEMISVQHCGLQETVENGLAKSELENNKLKNELNAFQNESALLHSKILTQQKDVETLTERNAALTLEVSVSSSELQSVLDQKTSIQAEVNDIQKELSDTMECLQTKDTQMLKMSSELQSQIEQSAKESNFLNMKIKEFEILIAELRSELDISKSKTKLSQASLEAKCNESQSLQDDHHYVLVEHQQTIDSLRSETEELQSKLVLKDSKVTQLQIQITELQATAENSEDLLAQVKNSGMEIPELLEKLNEAHLELAQVKQELETCGNEQSRLSQDRQNLCHEIVDLNKKVQESDGQIEAQHIVIQGLNESIDNLIAANDDLKSQVELNEKNREEWNGKVTTLEEENQLLRHCLTDIRKEREINAQKLEELENVTSAEEEVISQLRNESAELKKKLVVLEQQKSNLEQQLVEIQRQKNDVDNRSQELTQYYSHLQTAYSELYQQYQSIVQLEKFDIGCVTTETMSDIDQLHLSSEATDLELSKVQSNLLEQTAKNKKLEKEFSQVVIHNCRLEEEVVVLKSSLAMSEGNVAEKLASTQSITMKLQNEIEQLHMSLQQRFKETEEMKSNIILLEEQLFTSSNESQNLIKMINVLKTNEAQLNSEVHNLQREKSHAADQLEGLIAEYRQFEDETATLKCKISVLEQNPRLSFSSDVAEVQVITDETMENLTQVEVDLENTSAELEENKVKLHQAETEITDLHSETLRLDCKNYVLEEEILMVKSDMASAKGSAAQNVSEAQSTADRLQWEIEKLTVLLKDKTAETVLAKGKSSCLEDELFEVNCERDVLTQKIAAIEENDAVVTAEFEKKQQEYSQAAQQLECLIAECRKFEEENLLLKKELSSLQQSHKLLEQRYSEVEEVSTETGMLHKSHSEKNTMKLIEMSEALARAEEKLFTVEQRLNNVKVELNASEEDKEAFSVRCSLSEAEVIRLTKHIEELEGKDVQAHELLSIMKDELCSKVEELEANCDRIGLERKELISKLEVIQKQLALSEDEKAIVCEQFSSKVLDLENRCELISQERKVLQEKISDIEMQLESAEVEKQTLQKLLFDSNALVKQKEIEISELEQFQKQKIDECNEFSELAEELNSTKQQNVELESELAQLLATNATLASDLNTTEKRIDVIVYENATMEKNMTEALDVVKNEQQRTKTMAETLESVECNLEHALVENRHLQSCEAELHNKLEKSCIIEFALADLQSVLMDGLSMSDNIVPFSEAFIGTVKKQFVDQKSQVDNLQIQLSETKSQLEDSFVNLEKTDKLVTVLNIENEEKCLLIKEHTAQIDALNAEIMKLNKELESTIEKLRKSETDNAPALLQAAATEEQLRNECHQLHARCEQLEREELQRSSVITSLEEEVNQLKAKINQLTPELNAVQDMHSEALKLKDSLEELEEHFCSKEKECQNYISDINAMKGQIEHYHQAEQLLHLKVTEGQAEVDNVNMAFNDLNKAYLVITTEKEELQHRMAHLNTVLANISYNFPGDSDHSSLELLEPAISQMVMENQELNAKLEDSEKEHQLAVQQLNLELEQTQSKLTSLLDQSIESKEAEKKINDLTLELDMISSLKVQLQFQHAQLENNLVEKEQLISDVYQKLELLNEENVKVSTQLNDKNQEASATKEHLHAAELQIQTKVQEFETLESELKKNQDTIIICLKEELVQKCEQHEVLNEKVNQLETQHSDSELKILDISAKYDLAMEDSLKLVQNVKVLNGKLHQQAAQLATLSAENIKLHDELSQAANVSEALHHELDSVHAVESEQVQQTAFVETSLHHEISQSHEENKSLLNEIKAYREEIDKQQHAAHQMSQEYHHLSSENEALSQQLTKVKDIEETLSQTTIENEQLQTEKQALLQKYDLAMEDSLKLVQNVEVLNGKLQQQAAQLETLSAENIKLHDVLSQATNVSEGLRHELDSVHAVGSEQVQQTAAVEMALHHEISQSHEENKSLMNEIKAYREEIDKQQHAAHQMSQEYQHLSSENEALSQQLAKVKDIEESFAHTTIENEQLQTEKQALLQKLDQSNQRLGLGEQERQRMGYENQSLVEQLRQTQQRVMDLQHKVHKLEADICHINQESSVLQQKVNEDRSGDLQQEVLQISQVRDDALRQVGDLKEQVSQWERRSASLELKVAQNEVLVEQLGHLDKSVEELKSEKTVLANSQLQYQDIIAELQATLDSVEKERAGIKDQLVMVTEELTMVTTRESVERSQLEANFDVISVKLKQADHEKTVLNDDLQKERIARQQVTEELTRIGHWSNFESDDNNEQPDSVDTIPLLSQASCSNGDTSTCQQLPLPVGVCDRDTNWRQRLKRSQLSIRRFLRRHGLTRYQSMVFRCSVILYLLLLHWCAIRWWLTLT